MLPPGNPAEGEIAGVENSLAPTGLNLPAFAVKEGERIFITVPVLVYQPGAGRQGEGYEEMLRRFRTKESSNEVEVVRLSSDYLAMDPQNSKLILRSDEWPPEE